MYEAVAGPSGSITDVDRSKSAKESNRCRLPSVTAVRGVCPAKAAQNR